MSCLILYVVQLLSQILVKGIGFLSFCLLLAKLILEIKVVLQ
jgi:hypothetical protein